MNVTPVALTVVPPVTPKVSTSPILAKLTLKPLMVRLDKLLVLPMVSVRSTEPPEPPFRFKLRAVLSLSTRPRRVMLAPTGNALLDVVSSATFAPSTMVVAPPEPLSSVIA